MQARRLMIALVTVVSAFAALVGSAAAASPVATFAGTGASASSFNGRSSLVTIRHTARLELSRAMTLEAWVWPSRRLRGRRDIVVKSGRAGAFPYGLELTGGVPDAYARMGRRFAKVSASSALPARTWSFIAASYDGRRLRLYVDSRQVASRPGRGKLGASRGPLEVGGDRVWGRHFGGLIVGVRIYARALSIRPGKRPRHAPPIPTATTSTTAAPAHTSLPSITGPAVQGATLTASQGSWAGSPIGYSYRWEDCDASGASCSTIAGATSRAYVLQPGDAGSTIRVLVTATNALGARHATSPQTGVVRTSGSSDTYYVGQSGAGSGDGSSCANEEPATWFDTPSHWGSGTGRIGPGDVVRLCGTITSPLTAYASGTRGNPITVIWQPGATLSEPYCPGSGCVNTNGQSYLTVNGGSSGTIQSTSNGTLLAHHNGGAVGVQAFNCDGCTIENLTIADMYVHYYNASTHPTDPNGGGNGVEISGSDLTLASNTIDDVQNGVFAEFNATDSNIHISGNTITNINGGLLMAPNHAGGSIGPVFIDHNAIENFGNWDDASFTFHHDGIHCYTGAGAHDAHYNGVYIYDNALGGVTDVNRSDMDSLLILQSNNFGTECADRTSPFYIFNNVFTSTYSPGTALGYVPNGLLDASAGHPHVFNNTLVGGQASYSSTIFQAGGSAGGGGATSVEFENNVLTTADRLVNICDGVSSVLDGCSGAASGTFARGYPDHNVYAAGGALGFVCTPSTYAFSDFSSWRSCIGADSHSRTTSDAQLGADGSPAAGSPALGAGKNLTNLCTGALAVLCTDIAGTPRPATGAWSAGAYQ